jgi:TRAP transporter TAXI family solute receptor
MTGDLAGAIERNEIDLALVPANTAYFTYVEGAQSGVSPDNQLRVISALLVTPFILVVRPESGIRSVRGLRGHTIARSAATRTASAAPRQPGGGSSSAVDAMRVTELVLSAFGVLDHVRLVGGMTVEEMKAGFENGTLDAAFGTAYFLREAFGALTAGGARLVPIEGPEIEDLVQRFPFIRRAIVSPGTYAGQTGAVRTIGVDLLLVCRSGLDADLVYELTRQYFAALPALLAATHSVGRVELERAAASPIPLHEGAGRYYRESELYR